MLFRLFARSRRRAAALRLYDACVELARRPGFYTDLGVPDTVDGRFDMVTLHVAVVLRRMERAGTALVAEADALMRVMFDDMDRSLREMGVGDLSVGKKVRKMGEAFLGRARAYGLALKVGDRAALEDALARNLFRKSAAGPAEIAAMAGYVLALDADLAAADTEALRAGNLPVVTAVPDVHGA
ncbi:ubiquinol-cytochrome C chaperone family protein [Futiania mangrovi]|uniref:Ubiquinol-cytochrome C chaperone family protein n=1 Tax=Futiania mangrovi TaxID=2959716 RepID=A0A9J6PE22_9PROT|nr:ubiquinol-cytochrome C chaperone family protein [Futiania mangrovii]MCP1336072.1 ubiquinol-cytochrome C chaperone family protein [Futiania mangrovii]